MFTCLAIITGSLWGQQQGTFWVWDEDYINGNFSFFVIISLQIN